MVSSQRRPYDGGAGLAADLFDLGRWRVRRFFRHLLCIDGTTIHDRHRQLHVVCGDDPLQVRLHDWAIGSMTAPRTFQTAGEPDRTEASPVEIGGLEPSSGTEIAVFSVSTEYFDLTVLQL